VVCPQPSPSSRIGLRSDSTRVALRRDAVFITEASRTVAKTVNAPGSGRLCGATPEPAPPPLALASGTAATMRLA
jgi:hypothetical protein